ncbi:MAG TPA: CHAT domain-containing tetratricopeptide repeat protein [Ktedonobacteraceae bacterium]|nr:CHAT domain-containing tetratricopeptide repeat protein [Ktedonobacteraceae bacterium]
MTIGGESQSNMDNDLLLQYLIEHSLEEDQSYMREHQADLTDHAAIGILIKDEAARQRNINSFISLKLAELLIFFGEYVHHAHSYALGYLAKGGALIGLGYYQTALTCLDDAREEFLRLGDELNWARTLLNRMIACAWLGEVEVALQDADRAREVYLRHGEYYWACTVDHNTAVIYTQLGQYQEALRLYARMLAIYPTLTDQSEIVIKRAAAMVNYNQARNLSWLGQFEEAYRLLQQAQASYSDLEETSQIINVEINLADLDDIQGYYGSALRRYYLARDNLMQNELADSVLLAELMLKMANCLVKLNRAQEASTLAAEAVELYRRLGDSLDTGDALREYATILAASSRLREAHAALDEAWMLFTKGHFEHHASTTKLQQAELLLEIGDAPAAYEQAKLLKQHFDVQGLVSRSVRASLVMAGSLIEMARKPELWQDLAAQSMALQEAASLCEQIAVMAHQHNLQDQVYKSQYLLGQIANIQEDPEEAARHYEAAIVQIETILDDLVHDLSPSFLRSAWMVYEEMIALCLQQAETEQAFAYLERVRSIALRQYLSREKPVYQQEAIISAPGSRANNAVIFRTQHELEEWQQNYRRYSAQLADSDASLTASLDREVLEHELKRCEAKVSELFERLQLLEMNAPAYSDVSLNEQRANSAGATRRLQHINIAQLQQHLLPNQLLLEYYLHQDNLVIFAVTTDGLIIHKNPDGVAQLERLLPILFAHLDPKGWVNNQKPPEQAVRRLLHRLYDLLVGPLVAQLPSPHGYLTIVPYGPLHNLPFHALYDGEHFLIENFNINYLPASSILMHLDDQERGLTNGESSNRQSSQIPEQNSAIARLPLVFGYSEHGHLQRALEEARTVAELLGGRCYLEKEATIVRLIEAAPGSPIIHLATHGQSRSDAPNFSYVRLADGQLNAIDAFSLDLQECELVTLSGCETGLALIGGGDEQLGLGRAFLAAGAGSLVMSLWPVEDNATNELMQLFYRRLLDGESKVQALRAAQCSLLQGSSSAYSHPFFWAAFRLVGDIGILKYKKQ